MAISRRSSTTDRCIGVWLGILLGGYIWPIRASERNFDIWYGFFQSIEDYARNHQADHGDESYLMVLYSDRALVHVRSSYELYGAHPEVGPPDRHPDAGERNGVIVLNAGREFIQKNYLDLWAAACFTAGRVTMKQNDSMPENNPGPMPENDPFTDLENEAIGASRDAIDWMRDDLAFFYSEDLFLQKRVEQLARLHGKDDSELVAGLTGRQIIAYMREHLPEPDPRVLTGGAEPAVKRPIVDPENRFSDAAAGRVVADGSADRRTRSYLWPLLALVLMACAWGFIFVRRVRR